MLVIRFLDLSYNEKMVELPLEICRLKSFGISESSIHEYKKGTYKAEELDKIEVFDIRQCKGA